jgi:hypothetical protein
MESGLTTLYRIPENIPNLDLQPWPWLPLQRPLEGDTGSWKNELEIFVLSVPARPQGRTDANWEWKVKQRRGEGATYSIDTFAF